MEEVGDCLIDEQQRRLKWDEYFMAVARLTSYLCNEYYKVSSEPITERLFTLAVLG